MAENISSVTDNSFQSEVLDASNAQPVMVDFWADWCRPCHMLAPTVAEIANDYAGKLKVVKRSMCGRAKLPLLRQRLLYAA